MKLSSSYRWFSNVSYIESEEVFDCLVDIAITDLTQGHFLVEEQFGLRVYPASHIKSKLEQQNVKIIGRAIKKEKSLL